MERQRQPEAAIIGGAFPVGFGEESLCAETVGHTVELNLKPVQRVAVFIDEAAENRGAGREAERDTIQLLADSWNLSWPKRYPLASPDIVQDSVMSSGT